MPEDTLYTLRQIAQELDLPESTVRYYRDSFADYLPTVGTGRRRRYPDRAVAMLRVVAEGYAKNRSRAEIETQIGAMPGEPIDAEPMVSFDIGGDTERTADNEWIPKYIDGERERRDAMWHMAREIVRLGEAIDRQQVMLGNLAKQISESASRTLPNPQPQRDEREPHAEPPTTAPDAAPEPPLEARPTAPSSRIPVTEPEPVAGAAPVVAPAPVAPRQPTVAPQPEARHQPEPAFRPDAPPVDRRRPAAPAAPRVAPPPPTAGEYGSDLLELREQLARERELVERLRRSKLEIERRAADAEHRLGDQEPGPQRRSSIFTRFFNRD